jgi:HTH-type transcriptional regulator/antitoxin HipB
MRSKGTRSSAQTLADAVRLRRKTLGVTQIELAQLAGCGPVFIYDLESAKATLRLDKLLDVLDVLGLEVVVREGKARLRVEIASR